MIKRNELKLEYQQHQFYEYFNSIFDYDILVLDEPTSALDVKTERIIQKNVEALHCTRVLVTHRLNTVEKADKILIMDNGKIIDYGNHHYLYKNNKDYCDLYDSYMNKYQEEEAK